MHKYQPAGGISSKANKPSSGNHDCSETLNLLPLKRNTDSTPPSRSSMSSAEATSLDTHRFPTVRWQTLQSPSPSLSNEEFDVVELFQDGSDPIKAEPIHNDKGPRVIVFNDFEASSSTSSRKNSLSPGRSGLPISCDQKEAKKGPFQRSHRWKGTALFKTWGIECLLVLFAIGILVTIATVLALYQNQPQPSWQLGINLSTVIALLATMLRSSIVMIVEEVISQAKWIWQRSPQPVQHLYYFDNASRGPWGSFMLSFRVPKLLLSRHSSSAILACFITVFSLAIGSFTQQAIKSVPCAKPVENANASVALADRLAGVAFYRHSPGIYSVDHSLQASIRNALGGSYTSPSLLTDCTTGNCTFAEAYRTNGFCSKCVDTTKMLSFTYNESFYYRRASLPANLSVDYGRWDADALVVKELEIPTLDWASSLFDAEMKEIIGKSYSVMAANIISLTTAGCAPPETFASEYRCKPWTLDPTEPERRSPWDVVSASCAIYPCVKDLTARAQGGNFIETVIRTTPLTRPFPPPPDRALPETHHLPDFPCTLNGVRYYSNNISEAPASCDPEGAPPPHFCHGKFTTPDGVQVDVPYECGYSQPWTATFPLSQYLSGLFNGSCYVRGGTTGEEIKPKHFPQCSWGVTGLFNKGNATFKSISQTMEAVAVAITDAERLDPITRNEDNRKNTAYGVVWETTICTQFDWPWLLYPAILLFLTLVALVSIIWVSAVDEQEAPVWKSSTLPLLYCGDLGTLKELKQVAKQETVVLEKTSDTEDGKWHIVLKENQGERVTSG